MQAPGTPARAAADREEIGYRVIGAEVRVQLPDQLRDRVRVALHGLGEWPAREAGTDAAVVHVAVGPDGWRVEADGYQARAATEDDALLTLQEVILEAAAARRGDRLLFRGSVVTRGAQSVLIVGDLGSAHALLALALTTLGFHLVSVGTAAFDGRRLLPLPLRLAFRLEPADREALHRLRPELEDALESVTAELYRPRTATVAPEPTHVIFPNVHAGRLSLLRPISATAARSRLCSALVAAPEDQSPFAAVAAVLRHTRGVHLTIGDLTLALEQLSRLLPQWRAGS